VQENPALIPVSGVSGCFSFSGCLYLKWFNL